MTIWLTINIILLCAGAALIYAGATVDATVAVVYQLAGFVLFGGGAVSGVVLGFAVVLGGAS